MITQEKFDEACRKIMELRDRAEARYQELVSPKWGIRDHDYYRAYGKVQGCSQALQFLEDADRENE